MCTQVRAYARYTSNDDRLALQHNYVINDRRNASRALLNGLGNLSVQWQTVFFDQSGEVRLHVHAFPCVGFLCQKNTFVR